MTPLKANILRFPLARTRALRQPAIDTIGEPAPRGRGGGRDKGRLLLDSVLFSGSQCRQGWMVCEGAKD